MLGNLGVFSILKTNPFSHHLFKCNFIQNLDFKRFFVYLWNDSNEFFKIFSYNLHNIYNNVWNFNVDLSKEKKKHAHGCNA